MYGNPVKCQIIKVLKEGPATSAYIASVIHKPSKNVSSKLSEMVKNKILKVEMKGPREADGRAMLFSLNDTNS